MPDRIITASVRAGARVRSLEEDGSGHVKIKTTVAPEHGKANRDVIAMLAEHFHVPRSRIVLLRGQTSTKKVFKITA